MSLGIAFGTAVFAGLIFGFCMASYYRYGAEKHRIPLWKDFQPASHENSRTWQERPGEPPFSRGTSAMIAIAFSSGVFARSSAWVQEQLTSDFGG